MRLCACSDQTSATEGALLAQSALVEQCNVLLVKLVRVTYAAILSVSHYAPQGEQMHITFAYLYLLPRCACALMRPLKGRRDTRYTL